VALESKQTEARQLSDKGKKLENDYKDIFDQLKGMQIANIELQAVVDEMKSREGVADDCMRDQAADKEKLAMLETTILDLRASLHRSNQECAELQNTRKALEQEREKSAGLQTVFYFSLVIFILIKIPFL
jgi:predicted RNase H-like nuclease (RuvC/YqgF family)